MAQKRIVFNDTDGVMASPFEYGSIAEAKRFIKEFRARFKGQGYYLTAEGLRIPPKEVELRIVKTSTPQSQE